MSYEPTKEQSLEIEAELKRLCKLIDRPVPKLRFFEGSVPQASYQVNPEEIILSSGVLEQSEEVRHFYLAHEVGHMRERWWRLGAARLCQALKALVAIAFAIILLFSFKPLFPNPVQNWIRDLTPWSFFGWDVPLWAIASLLFAGGLIAAQMVAQNSGRRTDSEISSDRFAYTACGFTPDRAAIILRDIFQAGGSTMPAGDHAPRLRALGVPGERALAAWLAQTDTFSDGAPRGALDVGRS